MVASASYNSATHNTRKYAHLPSHGFSPTRRIDADPPSSTVAAHYRTNKQPTKLLNNDSATRVQHQTVNMQPGTTAFHPLLLNNFKYCLTLFSKFFSSFDHSTCSLSVSGHYLALDEIYHPIRAAIPNNSTLRKHVVRDDLRVKDGILTLNDTLFQKIYTRVVP